MHASFFIAGRLRFRGKFASVSIAVSFLVMILAVSISSGFRHEIRAGLSGLAGDVQLTRPDMNYLDGSSPVASVPSYLPHVAALPQVGKVVPAVYRAGIVKNGDVIYGVLVKGIPDVASERGFGDDSLALAVSVPSRLAQLAGLAPGDRMLTYFIGEKIKVRQFRVAAVHEAVAGADDRFLVYADIDDMRRLNGWDSSMASAQEVYLKPEYRDEKHIREAEEEIGFIAGAYSREDEPAVVASSSVSRFPQIFGWHSMIDFNVFFILLLMSIVAGFNMISGLLIMLFENISTIGLLKSLGMTDRSIAGVFLSSASILVLKGMAVGNFLALALCLVQDRTKVLELDPENYFVPFVPVHADLGMIALADIAAFLVIMLLMLLPCLFISKVDPSETVRVK